MSISCHSIREKRHQQKTHLISTKEISNIFISVLNTFDISNFVILVRVSVLFAVTVLL